MSDQNNPLPQFQPLLKAIDDIPSDINSILTDNKRQRKALMAQCAHQPTWDNLIEPLDDMDEKVSHKWSLVSHLHAVTNSAELHKAYTACLPELSVYSTEISHDKKLYEAILKIKESDSFSSLEIAQQKSIDNDIRDFKLSGVALSEDDKKTFQQLSLELSELASTFENNVLQATDNWTYHTTDEKKLSGMPQHLRDNARESAKQKNLDGWIFSLKSGIFIDVMTYADCDDLRQEMHKAYLSRASEIGPNAGKWDNTNIIEKTLAARAKLAKLLGFNDYAEYSLSFKMANSSGEVIGFLQQLADACHEKAKKEYQELCQFAKKEGASETLQPWQLGYYTEKLRQRKYHFSAEDLRPYFSFENVLQGLFSIVERLYSIHIKQITPFNSWHEDVRCFAIHDKKNDQQENAKPRAYFYLDPFARDQKRGGAWMDDCQSRRKCADGSLQLPIAFLVCNFTKDSTGGDTLLTHDDVVTLFHEFGHGLHHMMTNINCLGVSGINGVAWDAVELPSQFMENWAFEKQSLDLFAKHYTTGEALPNELFEKMQNARHFQAAMKMMRQLEFSLFDTLLHADLQAEQKPGKEHTVEHILEEVRAKTRVTPIATYDRFANSFSHIFAGGYACGYYSYKWAEVMAADAFALFKERGIFDKQSSDQFRSCILEKGGSEDADVLYRRFRGRDPELKALLEQEGIASS